MVNRDGTVIQWKDSERTRCEIWTRCMGFHRPITDYNIGKRQEYEDRKNFTEEIAMRTLVA